MIGAACADVATRGASIEALEAVEYLLEGQERFTQRRKAAKRSKKVNEFPFASLPAQAGPCALATLREILNSFAASPLAMYASETLGHKTAANVRVTAAATVCSFARRETISSSQQTSIHPRRG